MNQSNIYTIVSLIYVLVIGYDILNWFRYRNVPSKELKIVRLKSTITLFISITGCALVILALSFHLNIFNYRAPISYTDVDKLTLRDFKGFKIPGYTLDGEKKFAFITTSIDLKVHSKDVVVQAIFHPSRSYVYNEKLVDNALLRHELYHFHITEYFARLIRRDLSKRNNKPTRSEISELIKSYQLEERKMQKKYDEDSYHSYILSQQKKWEKKIDSLLVLHRNYSSPTLSFNQ